MSQRFPCPICGRTFKRYQIDLHVEQCLSGNAGISGINMELRSPVRRRRGSNNNNNGNKCRGDDERNRALLYINLKWSKLFGENNKRPLQGKYYLTLTMDSQKFTCDSTKVHQETNTNSINKEPNISILDWEKQFCVFEISRYFASSALRITLWKYRSFRRDIPVGMAIIQLGDIRRGQISSKQPPVITQKSNESRKKLNEKEIIKHDEDMITKSDEDNNLNKEILNKIVFDIQNSYGSAQKHTLKLHNDCIDSSLLSLELCKSKKKNVSVNCSLPSKVIYRRKDNMLQSVIGEVDLNFWYISKLDCIYDMQVQKNIQKSETIDNITLYSPLHYASMLPGGDILIKHMIQYLNVKISSSSLRRGMYKLSPFDIAGFAKNNGAIEILAKSMAPGDYEMPSSFTVNKNNNYHRLMGGTSLHFYCKYGIDISTLQSMVEMRPAMTDVLDDFGYTPFLISCKNGKIEFAKFLALQGVRIARKPIVAKNGDTALILACKGGHDAVVNWLIMREADPNLKNFDDESPLMHAASCSSGDSVAEKLVKILCNSGAVLRTQTDVTTLSTAFHRAAKCGHFKTFKTLVEQFNVWLENIKHDNENKIIKHVSVNKFLALVSNDGKIIYDLFNEFNLKANLYKGKTKEAVTEISDFYEISMKKFAKSTEQQLWNGLSDTCECTVDLCGPYGALCYIAACDVGVNINEKESVIINCLDDRLENARNDDSDHEYSYVDNNLLDTSSNVTNNENVMPGCNQHLLSNLKMKNDEEKVDIEETKDNENDIYDDNDRLDRWRRNTGGKCIPKTPNESLTARKKRILDILKVVVTNEGTNQEKLSSAFSRISYGLVAYKLHCSKWNVDQTVLELLSLASSLTLPGFDQITDHGHTKHTIWNNAIPSTCKQIIQRNATACVICLEEKNVFYALQCNHLFCTDCWINHLKVAVRTQGEQVLVKCRCPKFPNCNYLPDETAWEILAQPNDLQLYSNQLLSSYVKCNSDAVTYCSNKRCDRILHISNKYYVCKDDVKCSVCGHNFCFLCNDTVHSPASCKQLKQWKTKSNDDAALLAGWLMKNTKLCPKPGCKERLEKNEGCKHMTCKCNHEFCWDCLRPWSDHDETTGGFFRCAYFDPSKDYEKFDFDAAASLVEDDKIVTGDDVDDQIDQPRSGFLIHDDESNEGGHTSDDNKTDQKDIGKKTYVPNIKRHDSAASLANFTFHLKRYTAFDDDQNRASSLYRLFALIQQEQKVLVRKRRLSTGMGFQGKSRRQLYINFKSLPNVDQNTLLIAIMEVVKMYRTMKYVHIALDSLGACEKITSLETQLILHRMDSRVSTVVKLMKAIEGSVNGDQTFDGKKLNALVNKVVQNNLSFHEEIQLIA